MEIREEIARVAMDFYYRDGCREGHDLDYWLAAEQLVMTWHEPFEEREKHVAHEPAEAPPLLTPGEDEVIH